MKNNIDICLISPAARSTSITVPVALLYLHAWLTKNDVTAAIIDIKTGGQGIPLTATQIEVVKDRIVNTVTDLKPTIVGIPCYTAEFWDVIEITERIKRKHKCIIVVGGLHATIRPNDFCYEGTPIDAIVLGDGQYPLLEIAKRVNSGRDLQSIQGVMTTDHPEQPLPTPASFDEWDTMPLPDYSQLDMEFYTKPHTGIIRNVMASGVHIFTTIGCPFSCTFCANNNRKVRFRPITHVLDEISHLKQTYKIDSFYVLDDTFLIKKERVFEFISGLETRQMNLMWAMETRVNLIDEQTLAAVKKAGCIQVDFGVESGSPESLERMKKGITPKQIIQTFDLCKKYRMRTLANFMFNTPGEKQKDVEQTIAMIHRIKPTQLSVCLTVPFPGTSIYDEYVKPPLTKEEYRIYNTKYLYVQVADPRFAMAVHNLDIVGLRIGTVARSNRLRSLVDITLNPVYWKTVLKSKRKWQYAIGYTRGIALITKEKAKRLLKIISRKAGARSLTL